MKAGKRFEQKYVAAITLLIFLVILMLVVFGILNSRGEMLEESKDRNSSVTSTQTSQPQSYPVSYTAE